MKRSCTILLLACLLPLSTSCAGADREQDLLAILQSSAGATEKCSACQQLRTLGTRLSIPVLAGLLGEDRVGHAARYTLEGLPDPEAGAALRTALEHTSGLTRAGIIDSLGWRRDTDAVSLLRPLMKDPDVIVAGATATALGRIGGQDAISALSSVEGRAPAEVQSAALEGLLRCAERLLAGGEESVAASLYGKVLAGESSEALRVAAWRGLLRSKSGFPEEQVQPLLSGLASRDHPLHTVALEVIRETDDTRLLARCWAAWDTLPASSQVAVLDAQFGRGSVALAAVQRAGESPHLEVRVAAWQALAEVEDTSTIPLLASAAARGEPVERDAARNTLARLRGPDMTRSLSREIQRAEPAEQAELLQALGARGDPSAADVLLQYATAEARPVRYAALASLRTLALPETLAPLLDVAAKTTGDREPLLQALVAVGRADADQNRVARSVLETIDRGSPAQRRQLLPLLAEFATPAALEAAEEAAQSADPELAKEALRVLAQWPNASPAPRLLEIARSSSDTTLHVLALRGAIAVSAHEQDIGRQSALLKQALGTARRVEEKKQVLGQIGRASGREALDLALSQLGEPQLANEAGLAALIIAESFAASDPQLADEVAGKVLATSDAPAIFRRAWALRVKPQAGGPRIRDWQLSGPYSQAGVSGAQAVFDLVFPPEQTGRSAEWQTLPPNDHVNLSALFPGRDNCVAYLKTKISAREATTGAILLGSDDGVKVWLNGDVVHSNNIDRGEVPDQDVAPVRLRQGVNDLLLKVSQGGGGWSVSARIVGPDGQPIAGLRAVAE